jgi:predicted nucleic acid-binding protein
LPLRQGNDELLQQFDDFFASADLTKLPITTETFDLATELRALQGVKTPDALHLATAILGECQEFWTNDLRLTTAAQDRIKIKAFS